MFSSVVRVSRKVHFAYLMFERINCLRVGRGATELEARRNRLEKVETMRGELDAWIKTERKELKNAG